MKQSGNMTRGQQIAYACDKISNEAAVELASHIDAVIEEYARELDPPVCRLQFPDGSVPGNAREAAEGWKSWYEKAQAFNDKVFFQATEAVKINGGIGEGGHTIDRLIWLSYELQKARKSLEQSLRSSWWLIEMQGPAYLSVRHCGGYEFGWCMNHNGENGWQVIRLANQAEADFVMMAVRQLRGDLFPACLPVGPRAVE